MSRVVFKKMAMSPVTIRAFLMSILKRYNVTCRILETAHVMSLILFPMSIGFMSLVDFKKRPCRPVGFKGQGLLQCSPRLNPLSSTPHCRVRKTTALAMCLLSHTPGAKASIFRSVKLVISNSKVTS